MRNTLMFGAFAGAALGLLVAGGAVASEDDYELPLKLFGPQDIDGGLGACRFSFWQANRDPVADRYAYLFHANETVDGMQAPAQLKIGSTFYRLGELVSGGEPVGGLSSQYLYATDDRKVKVQIELRQADFRQGAFYFDEAKLTVIQKGKLPFTANAKGLSGCPLTDSATRQSASAAQTASEPTRPAPQLPDGIPIGPAQYLDGISQIPRSLRQLARDYASDDCDFDGFFAWSGARHVINEYYVLWQIPCFSGAYQASSVLAVTQNPPQGWGELLTIPNPPGLEGQQNYAAFNLDVYGSRGHLMTTEVNRGLGDCGSHQILRLIDGPGEVLELELLLYRDKPVCDGNANSPEGWPLVYQAY